MKSKSAIKFDWSLARDLAEWSERAYQDASATDPATDAQALVSMRHDGVVVAFRGSSSPADFMQDGKFDLRETEWSRNDLPAEIHAGFLEDWLALEKSVVGQVKKLLATHSRVCGSSKIHVTGHSLGGALAIPCALELARLGLPVATVITFGQPRVGNTVFRDIYNDSLGDRTFHVVNANDPVPLLPPLGFGYRDEGNEIFLPRHSGYALNPSIGFELINDLFGMLDSWRRCELAFLPNHLMSAYIERISPA